MTELLVIRHGETDWNREQRFQGQIDVPLNATGIEQARRLGQRLAAERVDALYCSDLQRAQTTAAPLVAAWNLPIQQRVALREQSFGVFEGLEPGQIRARHPDLWTHWLAQRGDYALPGGESTVQFHARVLAEVQALALTLARGRIAIVTHGGVLDMLWRQIKGLPLDGHRDCEIPNAGINRLRWEGGRLNIEAWADASHLDGLPPQPATAPAAH
jgi:probable phosphoglycerate mutase